jgi:hypothetical protein
MARVHHSNQPGLEDLDIPPLVLTPQSTQFKEHKRY